MRVNSVRLFSLFGILAAALLAAAAPASALDLTGGLMYAVPVLNGHAPAIDGKLDDWDLSGAEPVWATDQTAEEMHASVSVEYDENALYLCAQVVLPNRALRNVNGPFDRYWDGDEVEFRVGSDPALPFPMQDSPTLMKSNRVAHVTIWKDTVHDKNYMMVQYGSHFDLGHETDPPGSEVAFVEVPGGYVAQARIPWSALNVPDGKNPFKPGQRMTATLDVHWGGEFQIPMLYIQNPGLFAFGHPGTWGQLLFSPAGNLKPHHGTMEEAIAAASPKQEEGIPVTVDVPDTGKLSINILGPDGQVIRELCGGVDVTPGKYTAIWDGRDQWGVGLTPGSYKWGAYLSHGLKPDYMGQVGTSGNPPTHTADITGGWGGDHSCPIGVSADSTGMYFAWVMAEAQALILKTDYNGKTLWRKNPFVNGGYGPVMAIASNGRDLFMIWDLTHPVLSRQDAATGTLLQFGKPGEAGVSELHLTTGAPVSTAGAIFPVISDNGYPITTSYAVKNPMAPVCMGLAANESEVFASIYPDNQIQVLDPQTGVLVRTLACPSPRGLALDAAGNLYAVSYGANQAPQIVEFHNAQGSAAPVVTANIEAPFGVAVDAAGNIHVTDMGPCQQVKTFSPEGKLLATAGKAGGRPWAGTYDKTAFLKPTGICVDPNGGVLVAECSIPKVFDRLSASSGKLLDQWFGWPAYGTSNIGDSDDPWTSYYPFEPGGFARATVPAPGGEGFPSAYWDLQSAGVEGVNELYDPNCMPYVKTLANGRKYFIEDDNPHGVCLIDGDRMLPVGHLLPGNTAGKPYLEAWIDRNGDHKPQPDEIQTISTIGGKPLPDLCGANGSMWIGDDGSAYFEAVNNAVIKIPSDGFEKSGAIDWDLSKMSYYVPVMVPSLLEGLGGGGRYGLAGIWLDSKGDLYTCGNLNIPGLTPDLANKIEAAYPNIPRSEWCAYDTPLLAKQMYAGLGHSSEMNAFKFAKYGPDGKMLWIAGRKALAAPGPGEMYHFWSLAGLVGDNYVAGWSEWGTMYVYTSDGFFVASIFNDPNRLPPPGPYTFGGETFGGRIQAFPKLGQVWAYNQGALFMIDGFDKDLHVEGERRWYGSVALDKVYGGAEQPSNQAVLNLWRAENPIANPQAWDNVEASTIVQGATPLAEVKLGYDDQNVYARFHVNHPGPIVNVADDIRLAFRGGDAVAIDLGPTGDRSAPVVGDVRIIAAMIGGKPRLIAMKPQTNLAKHPESYFTPAGGTKNFDFVGDVPGGQVSITPDADGKGYTVLAAIPLSFLEMSVVQGGMPLKGDVEVLVAGQGGRGTQTISRNPLFGADHEQMTMVDDAPTESWLYPQYWGDVQVK